MDELMARFVTNMERNECTDRFKEERKVLFRKSLRNTSEEAVEQSVKQSVGALRDLLSSNTIEMERQRNSENNLYLKLMERV